MQISTENKKQNIAAIISVIRANNNFLLVSHISPDGDSIGSQLALADALRTLGKSVVLYSEDKVPDNYLFLPGAEGFVGEPPNIAGIDVVFILDCGELKRIGELCQAVGALGKTGLLVNIDHHHSNKAFCPLALVDETASSTSELVLAVILALGVKITPPIANSIYAGILTDTGGFRYSSTGSEALLAAARMVEAGANPQWLSENIYENNPPAKLRLFAFALSSLQFSQSGEIAWLTLSASDIKKSGALLEHTEGLVELPRGVGGVAVAILFTELANGYYKVSLRSKGEVNVSAIAAVFGGGGHINAAACRVQETIETLAPRVIQEAQRIIAERMCC